MIYLNILVKYAMMIPYLCQKNNSLLRRVQRDGVGVMNKHVLTASELSIKELFDVAFQVLMANWQRLLVYLLVLVLVTWAVRLPLMAWLTNQEAVLVTGLELLIIQSLIAGLITSTAVLVMMPMVSQHLATGKPLAQGGYLASYRKLPMYGVTVLCYGLMNGGVLGLGFLWVRLVGTAGMAVVASVVTVVIFYLLVSFSFYLYHMTHTATWGFKNLAYSHLLVRGRLFKTLLVNLIGTLLAMMAVQITSFLLSLLGLGGLVGALIGEYVALVVSVYLMLTMSVWYLNRLESWQISQGKGTVHTGEYE